MILRRLVSCFALALLVTASAADPAPRRPNILWLAGENLAHDLGCYGEKHVRTPHLDRLAAEGVRYTNVIATNPTCAPSRSAFFTGMYQTTTDTHPMRSHRTDAYRLPEGVRPVTHRLRDAGYFTANLKNIPATDILKEQQLLDNLKSTKGHRTIDLTSLAPDSLEKLRKRNQWRAVLQKNLQNISVDLLTLDEEKSYLADPKDLMKVLDRRMKTTTGQNNDRQELHEYLMMF